MFDTRNRAIRECIGVAATGGDVHPFAISFAIRVAITGESDRQSLAASIGRSDRDADVGHDLHGAGR